MSEDEQINLDLRHASHILEEDLSKIVQYILNRNIKTEVEECVFLSCSDGASRYTRPLSLVSMAEMGYKPMDKKFDVPPELANSCRINIDKILEYIKRGAYADFVMKVGSKNIRCHLILLKMYSDFFLPFKPGDKLEVPAGQMTVNGFQLLYNWMVHESETVHRSNILEIFQAANYLRVEHLAKHIWLYFDSSEFYKENTAFTLAQKARALNMNIIHDMMMMRVVKFFFCLVTTDYFLNLDETVFLDKMQLNSLAVNSEMEVFMIIVRWLNHDWEKRKGCAMRALDCLRITHFPKWFLIGLRTKEKHKFSRRVLNIPEFQNKLGKLYVENTLDRFFSIRLLIPEDEIVEKEDDRNWIVNIDCSHHHKPGCVNWKHITFESFNDYLKTIIAERFTTWKKFVSKHLYQYPPCCLEAVELK